MMQLERPEDEFYVSQRQQQHTTALQLEQLQRQQLDCACSLKTKVDYATSAWEHQCTPYHQAAVTHSIRPEWVQPVGFCSSVGEN